MNDTTDGAQTKTFELALVMAGAISAGAYTAGVVDFLLEALEEWDAAKAQNVPNTPHHRAIIKVMAGASAGGITSALAAAALGGKVRHDPAGSHQAATDNPFYNAWVRRIDFDQLLTTRDLEDEKAKVISALDSTVLKEIVDDTLKITPSGQKRPYLADPLQVMLSVTNLRGVPYDIHFANLDHNETDNAIETEGTKAPNHEMTAHGDFVRFAVSHTPVTEPGVIWLDPANYTDKGWEMLGQAALATSAFPVGLSARTIERPAGDYNNRAWSVPGEQAGQRKLMTIPPSWKSAPGKPDRISDEKNLPFLMVDGGVVNNEPLEFARRLLAGKDGLRNPRDGLKAERAVVMIDPFPNSAPFDHGYQPDKGVVAVVKGVVSAMLNQARFKMDELVLAQDESVYSRFLIAPTRTVGGKAEPHAIACGALGGFGGFLSEDFRHHDFQLGRRNCQRFLRDHLALPADNPLVKGWDEAMDQAHGVWPDGTARTGKATWRPIIPLCGSAAKEVALPDFPKLSKARMDALEAKIGHRSRAVIGQLIEDLAGGGVMYRLAGWFARRKIVKSARNWIEQDLAARSQLTYSPPKPKKRADYDDGPEVQD